MILKMNKMINKCPADQTERLSRVGSRRSSIPYHKNFFVWWYDESKAYSHCCLELLHQYWMYHHSLKLKLKNHALASFFISMVSLTKCESSSSSSSSRQLSASSLASADVAYRFPPVLFIVQEGKSSYSIDEGIRAKAAIEMTQSLIKDFRRSFKGLESLQIRSLNIIVSNTRGMRAKRLHCIQLPLTFYNGDV